MPVVIFLWLLLPWLFDIWLTVMLAKALAIDVWAFFLVPAVAGFALLFREWRRIQNYWRALRRMEGSPWQLLASARRALAAFLLILPGILSGAAGILLLCASGRADDGWTASSGMPSGGDPAGRTGVSGNGGGVIEGEYRRED